MNNNSMPGMLLGRVDDLDMSPWMKNHLKQKKRLEMTVTRIEGDTVYVKRR